MQALRDEVAALRTQLDEARANEQGCRRGTGRGEACASEESASKAKHPAKKASTAKKAPAKKAAATMTTTKKATATKSAGREPPRKTAATAESVSSGEK